MRNVVVFIIGLLSVCLLCLGLYGLSLSKDRNKVVVVNDYNKYVGYYGIENKVKRYSTDDENTFYDILYIRYDGTYYLSINSYLFEDISVGTYTYDDNGLLLRETVRYGSNDMCFYKGNNTEYVISLVGDNLSVNYNGKDYLFEKGIGISETVSNKNYYISFPEDGKIPIGWGSPWIDCDKQRDLEK